MRRVYCLPLPDLPLNYFDFVVWRCFILFLIRSGESTATIVSNVTALLLKKIRKWKIKGNTSNYLLIGRHFTRWNRLWDRALSTPLKGLCSIRQDLHIYTNLKPANFEWQGTPNSHAPPCRVLGSARHGFMIWGWREHNLQVIGASKLSVSTEYRGAINCPLNLLYRQFSCIASMSINTAVNLFK